MLPGTVVTAVCDWYNKGMPGVIAKCDWYNRGVPDVIAKCNWYNKGVPGVIAKCDWYDYSQVCLVLPGCNWCSSQV